VPDRPGRRALLVTVLLLVAAAAALWGSAAAVWPRPSYDTPFRGQVLVTVEGGEWEPVLGPLALLALAGVAGALATGGWLRRIVGVVLAAAGGWAVVLGARPQSSGVPPAGLDDLPGAPSGGRLSDVLVIEPWTLLASLGGLLLLAAGGLLVLRTATMPRLGGRYTAPARARREPAQDRERALWDSLDAGEDPTERPR
jgi:hypothetical protein